jgi:hypothetical protein
MEGLEASAPAAASARGGWRDRTLLAVLLVLATALHGWLLYNTEVAARDSIGFIRYALQFEGRARLPHVRSWRDVIRANHQHPGFPLSVLAVSLPVRYWCGGTSAAAMQLSAQLASSLAAVLLVIPMFYLGKVLFDRGVGFWAALLFQCLPVSGHILSDGLSEALFLLLSTTSLLCAAHALRGTSWMGFVVCGAFGGLAYWVRPEGGLLLVAAGSVLCGMQLVPRWRRPWRSFAASGASLALAGAAVASPYVLITGHLTNKPSPQIMVGKYNDPKQRSSLRHAQPGTATFAARRSSHPLVASLFGVGLRSEGPLVPRLRKGLWALAEELVRGYHYLAWLPAGLGVWWYAGRLRTVPGLWALLVLCALHLLVLWWLAAVVGYVSERHIQTLILAGCYPAVAFLRDLPHWLAGRWNPRAHPNPTRQRGPLAQPSLARRVRVRRYGPLTAGRLPVGVSYVSVLLLVSLIGAGLPKTLQKLHANRAGYHAAGRWLAEHVVHRVDQIEDGHCWAHFYAGEVFEEGKPELTRPGVVPTRYVVVGRHPERDPSPSVAERDPDVRTRGRVVYCWPPQRAADAAEVVVYAVPLTR